MTPREYELLVGEEFQKRGYQVQPQRGTGDWGVDLFATRAAEKLAIQVKMYGDTARPVNRAMIMELEGARRYFDCSGAALVTNGRVLPDAQKVADKLGISIQQLAAAGAVANATEEGLHFEQIWTEWIMPLAGKTLTGIRGENKVVRVDWSGIQRISSSGKSGFIPIEVFRGAVDRLLQGGTISREEINDLHVGRASSAVCLVLSQAPFFSLESKPAGLRFVSTNPESRRQNLSQTGATMAEPEQATLLRESARETTDVNELSVSPIVEQAKCALAPPGRRLDDPELVARDGAGLYAIYGSAEVWEQLGLGAPPNDRPLYVGKAEESVINRDVKQHFRTGSTGSSTVRRSLAAFLRGPLDLKAQPRNTARPDHFPSYSLNPDGDVRLTEWMHANLRLALWIRPGDDDLRPIESALMQHWQPPLNGHGVKTPWSAMRSAARKSMADEARAWKP